MNLECMDDLDVLISDYDPRKRQKLDHAPAFDEVTMSVASSLDLASSDSDSIVEGPDEALSFGNEVEARSIVAMVFQRPGKGIFRNYRSDYNVKEVMRLHSKIQESNVLQADEKDRVMDLMVRFSKRFRRPFELAQ